MKRDFIYSVILVFLLLPSQFLILKGYKSLDGLIHIKRIEEFHEAILQEQFPVRLAPTLVNEIGYPLFIVNYQLPYYLAEVVLLVNNNAELAYKAVMLVSFLLSGIFAYLLFLEISSHPAALAGAIIYSYLPYRFGDLYMRGAFGESVSFAFIPLVFYGVHRVFKNGKYGLIIFSLGIFSLITTHTVVFVMILPILLLYTILLLRSDKSHFFRLLLGFILGICLSSVQLIPAIFEKHYLKFDTSIAGYYKDFFTSIYQILRIPKMGLDLGSYFQIGLVSTLLLGGGVIYFFNKNKFVLLFLVFNIISIFMNTSFSLPLWNIIPGINYIIYPYRFFIISILATAFLAVYFIDFFKSKIYLAIILILLTLYTNRHFYLNNPPWFEIEPTITLTTLEEANTIWTNENTFINRPLISSNEKFNILNEKISSYSITFATITEKNTNILIRKMYFPGWQAKINGINSPIDIKDGLISIEVPSGNNHVEVYFSESPLRKTANLITVLSFAILIFIFVKRPKLLQP